MSNTIDQRIVDMRFENKQFESGIQSSIKSLDNLKSSLKLDGASRGLADLERAGRTFSLAGIASSVETIAGKFTNLGIVGVTVLQNLTNSAINAGKRMISALTLDPIKMGYGEYETKMGSIQTILTNTADKGTTLEDINKALNELNEYSDKTIYNFEEMTRNIGTFTAAGVDLNTSVTAIKGIANLAAGSGSNAQQASTAMYQLSQALAAGSVKLQDWNSVVNAGMGGQLFQKALEKTAEELGHGRDMSVSFRESLEKGWITTEVLTKTLQKFANDDSLVKAATQVKTFTQLFDTMRESVQSGWAQTWETIIGNKDESTLVLTKINDIFGSIVGSASDARNSMLKFWKDNGGRYDLIEAIFNAFKGLQEVLDPITKAFKEIFPPMTGQRLVEITRSIRDLTRNFKIGDETANNIKRTFKGLFAILDIGKQAVVAIGKGIGTLVNYLLPAGDGLLSFTGDVGDFLVSLDKGIKASDIFNKAIEKVCTVLKVVANGVKVAITLITDAFNSLASADTSGLDSFAERVKKRFEPLTRLGEFVKEALARVGEVLKKVAPGFYKLASIIGGAFDALKDKIANAFGSGDFSTVLDVVNGGLFAAILVGLKKFIGSLTSISKNVGSITSILDGVKGSLEAYQKSLKADALIKIAVAIGILAASLFILSTIDSAKLTSSLAAMTAMFGDLLGSMAIFEKIVGSTKFIAMTKLTIALLGLSVAILILSAAMTKLAKMDWDGLMKGLVGVAALSAIMVQTAKMLSNSSGALIKGSMGFVIFAIAINVLTTAVEKLGQIDTAKLAKGLIGVGVLAAELALFMKTTDLTKMSVGKGIGLMALAVAILVLASAVEKFSQIDAGALLKGLAGVGAVLTEVAIFVNLTGDAKKVISTATGLTILGVAMLIFATAIQKMGSMPLEQIAKGLFTMGTSLVIVLLALQSMPKNIIGQALGLVVISGALLLMSVALKSMAGMSWEQIAKGLVTLAGSMTIIAVAMAFMTTALPGAAALLVVAASLAILTPCLIALGNLSLAEIGKSLLALAGAFTIIGLAGLVLTPLIPSLLGLGAAITLLGIGCLAAGAGLVLFSTGLAALAVSGTAGVAALVAAITAVVGMIPYILKTIAIGLVEFARVIGEGAPVICNAFKQLLLGVATMIIQTSPQIMQCISVLLTGLLNLLVDAVPKLVDAGMKLILGILKGVADNISKITAMAIQIVVNFIKGVASMLPKVIQAGFDFIISFINGLADAIRKNTDPLIAAMRNLMLAVVESAVKILTGSIKTFIEIGGQVVTGLIKGITGAIGKIKEVAVNLGKTVSEAFKGILGIHSPSKVFQDYGANIVAGLKAGIKDNTPKAAKESANMAKTVSKASKKEFEKHSKEEFQTAVDWIDERKYYNQMSLKQELVAWEALQKKYKQGTEERKKADREVYRVKQELIKQEQDLQRKAFDNSTSWIEEQKYYNKLSLADELAAWERVQKRYKAGTEERKKADREVYRVKQEMIAKQKEIDQEYYDATKAINDQLANDIQSLNDQYEQALQSRTDSLYSTYGLFDKVEKQDAFSGTQLIKNLQDQVNAFQTWQDNLASLSAKGVDNGLMDELEAMGPQSLAQIKALNGMSSEQLAQYVALWQQKHAEASEQATSELAGLRKDTDDEINKLKTEADANLETYKTIWTTKTAELRTGVNTEMTQLNTDVSTSVNTLKTETEKTFTDMTVNIQKIMSTPDWAGIGANIVLGMTTGVKSKAAILASEVANTAKLALQAAKTVLGIKSPSREFAKVGMYADEGLAEGLRKFSGVVTTSAQGVGSTAITALKGTIANISDAVSTNIDTSPTIKPVLDLSSIEKGSNSLNSIFGQQQVGLAATTASNRASSIATGGKIGQNGVTEAPVKGIETSEVVHKGTITVKGVNSMDELMGVVEVVIENSLPRMLRREVRMQNG